MEQLLNFLGYLKARRVMFALAPRPQVGVEVQFATVGARVDVVFADEGPGFAVFSGNEDVFNDDAALVGLIENDDVTALARARAMVAAGPVNGRREGLRGIPGLRSILERLDARGMAHSLGQQVDDGLELRFGRPGLRVEVSCEVDRLNFSVFVGDEALVHDEAALKAFIADNHG